MWVVSHSSRTLSEQKPNPPDGGVRVPEQVKSVEVVTLQFHMAAGMSGQKVVMMEMTLVKIHTLPDPYSTRLCYEE